MRAFLRYALWTDLRRRSSWALVLSMIVITVSVALCSVLFSVAQAVRSTVEAEIIKSGAANSMEVAARPDREYRKPWAAAPIGTEDPTVALERLHELLRKDLGEGVITDVVPAWLSPGWVYMFLTPPEQGGVPVSVGVSLTSPDDPEKARVEGERLAGQWIDSDIAPQIVLPKKLADRLWRDVLFVGETAWLGITETSTCAKAEVTGIYGRTQRNYSFASEPVAVALQSALDAAREGEVRDAIAGPLRYDRIRLYFRDRRILLRARALVEERYKFWAMTPYDKFESKLRLAAAARISAWAVFGITLGSACGAIFCTFLAWVSRRRYEIALLKAQGSGNAWVAGTYIAQSGAAGLAAGVAGVLVGRQVCPVLAHWVSRQMGMEQALALQLPWSIAGALAAAAVTVALAAAVLPAWVAARQDPWEILREAA